MYRQCEQFTAKLNINIIVFLLLFRNQFSDTLLEEGLSLLCSILDTIKVNDNNIF